MSTRLVLTGPSSIGAVSVNAREFAVDDGIVRCTEAEAVEIAADLAPHGFVLASAEAVETPQPAELVAVHRGGGSYSVMRGEEEVLQGLKKSEAAEFNAQPAADREALLALAQG